MKKVILPSPLKEAISRKKTNKKSTGLVAAEIISVVPLPAPSLPVGYFYMDYKYSDTPKSKDDLESVVDQIRVEIGLENSKKDIINETSINEAGYIYVPYVPVMLPEVIAEKIPTTLLKKSRYAKK